MLAVHPSLLITDDDRDFRETLREVFESRGFRTLLAADGEEALRIVRLERIHVVVVDMYMPRLSGLETVQRLRESRLQIPCILLSSAMDERLATAAREFAIFAALSKPISFVDITRVVGEAVRVSLDSQNALN